MSETLIKDIFQRAHRLWVTKEYNIAVVMSGQNLKNSFVTNKCPR